MKTFNRTSLELKLSKFAGWVTFSVAFNRTSLELKPSNDDADLSTKLYF